MTLALRRTVADFDGERRQPVGHFVLRDCKP